MMKPISKKIQARMGAGLVLFAALALVVPATIRIVTAAPVDLSDPLASLTAAQTTITSTQATLTTLSGQVEAAAVNTIPALVDQVFASSSVTLTQVTNISSLTTAQVQGVVSAAVNDAIASGVASTTLAQQASIITAATASIQGLT